MYETHECAACRGHFILADLYCALSHRGANSNCQHHNYSDLYCNACLFDMGFLDEMYHFGENHPTPDPEEIRKKVALMRGKSL